MNQKKETAILITGANGGLGRACIKMAEKLDIDRIIATDLTLPKFNNCDNYQLDVSSEEDIKLLKAKLEKDNISVKYLINNAGIFNYFPISEATEELLDSIVKVNTYGPLFMISQFKSHLMENKGKVIQISSVSVKLPIFFMPYPNTKIALEAFSTSARQELKIVGVDLIIIRPGAMRTNLLEYMKDIQNPIQHSSYQKEFSKFTSLAKKEVGKIVEPEKVAQLIYKAIQSKNPKRIYSINKNRMIGLVLLFPLWLRDRLILRQVR